MLKMLWKFSYIFFSVTLEYVEAPLYKYIHLMMDLTGIRLDIHERWDALYSV